MSTRDDYCIDGIFPHKWLLFEYYKDKGLVVNNPLQLQKVKEIEKFLKNDYGEIYHKSLEA